MRTGSSLKYLRSLLIGVCSLAVSCCVAADVIETEAGPYIGISGGKTLEWHHEKHSDLIAQPWDIVILQEFSTRPLTSSTGNGKGADRQAFYKGIEDILVLVEAENPDVKVYLYETWARPNLVLSGHFPDLEAMQAELREGYSQAATDFALAGWFPVGDGFLAAVNRGISDNPATEVTEGPIDIWGTDKYHQSKYGAYLSALVIYQGVYNADPRELPVGPGSTAAELDIDPEIAEALQTVAYNVTLDQTAR